MKKALCVLLSFIMIMTTSLCLPISATAEANVTSVDLSETHQTMNGFGASACWWSQDVGGWKNLDDIMALLYSKDKGIGLNIYRYNLGAGSKNDHANYTNDRDTECFLNADGTYTWTNDANAQKALASAKKLAGNNLRVTLFCNSAPIYLTKNGKAFCDGEYWNRVSNLDAENYNAFADFGLKCAEYFIGKGYRVTDVSPVNEPLYDWSGWGEGTWASQEGCYYSREEVRDLGIAFVNKFKNSTAQKNGCQVSLFEACEMSRTNDLAIADTNLEDYINCLFSNSGSFAVKNLKLRSSGIDTISMHSYWSSKEGKQATAELLKNDYQGKYKVAQTEYCQMEADGCSGVYELVNSECGGKMTSGLTMPYGLALANIIYDDLTILDVVEWDWWTACAYGGYTDGLVYLDKSTHEIDTSKRLYALGNFSKFTDEGSVRVDAGTTNSDVNTVAFKNNDGSVSVVLINNSENNQQTKLNISGITSSCQTTYETYVTDDTRDLKKNESGVFKNSTVTLPKQSVTTVVVKPYNTHKSTSTVDKATLSKAGTVTTKCSVCGKTLSTATIASPKSFKLSETTFTYTGKAITPSVTVKDSAGKTIASSNYSLSYRNNKNVGKASVKITFKGNYSGSKTLYFTINPKNTSISKITAEKKGFTVKWKKLTTQTTGYQIQYSTSSKFSGAKTVKISKNSKTSSKVTGLKANKKYYVRIRTYKTIGKTSYYSAWSGYKTVTTKK